MDAGHGLRDAAWNDVLKIRKIGVEVQREPVGRDPAADVNADGGDLAAVHPNAGQAGNALGSDGEIGERIDEDLFEGSDVEMHVLVPARKIQNGVAHDLPGTMICHIAATVGFVKSDSGAAQNVVTRQQIFGMTVASDGDDVRMLDEQQLIRNKIVLALFDELPLQCERLGIREASEVAHIKH